jgi:hypothetical protein
LKDCLVSGSAQSHDFVAIGQERGRRGGSANQLILARLGAKFLKVFISETV